MEKKIQVLIVEDEFIIADYIEDCLTRLGYEATDTCASYNEAVASLQKTKPDIAILDISIKGEKNGIDLAEYITEKIQIPFVFASSHGDKGTVDKAKQTKPSAYLIKPFTEEDLYASIETALVSFSAQKNSAEEEKEIILINDGFFIRHKNKFVKVLLDELLYLEANDNYVSLFTADTHYTLKTTLLKLQEVLPDSFLRIQKSYIVNLQHLQSFDTEEVMIHNRTLPIGKNYADTLLEKIKIVKG